MNLATIRIRIGNAAGVSVIGGCLERLNLIGICSAGVGGAYVPD